MHRQHASRAAFAGRVMSSKPIATRMPGRAISASGGRPSGAASAARTAAAGSARNSGSSNCATTGPSPAPRCRACDRRSPRQLSSYPSAGAFRYGVTVAPSKARRTSARTTLPIALRGSSSTNSTCSGILNGPDAHGRTPPARRSSPPAPQRRKVRWFRPRSHRATRPPRPPARRDGARPPARSRAARCSRRRAGSSPSCGRRSRRSRPRRCAPCRRCGTSRRRTRARVRVIAEVRAHHRRPAQARSRRPRRREAACPRRRRFAAPAARARGRSSRSCRVPRSGFMVVDRRRFGEAVGLEQQAGAEAASKRSASSTGVGADATLMYFRPVAPAGGPFASCSSSSARIVGDALAESTLVAVAFAPELRRAEASPQHDRAPASRNGRWLNISALVWNSGITHSVRSAGVISKARAHDARSRHHVVVRQQHALGVPGGPRRVDQQRAVVAADRAGVGALARALQQRWRRCRRAAPARQAAPAAAAASSPTRATDRCRPPRRRCRHGRSRTRSRPASAWC